tara:strand:- start:55 stop:354 length:300 start_codon:yes stop_codon:yes gene_type:complete
MNLVNEIKTIISTNLPDSIVIVEDPNNDGEHFEAIVISDLFEGMPLLKQHQSIMKPLKEAFDSKVHALALKTFSTRKWEAQKENFPIIEKRLKEQKNDN